MIVPNRNYSSPSYRYGFNGMEKDDEVSGDGNSVDFGVRMYDPRIARLKSVDPNAKELPNFSPYQYSRNNPIMLKENGMDGVIPPWLWRNYPWLISPVHAGFIDAIADDAVGLFDVVKTAQAFNPGMPFFYTSGGKQVRAETIETTKLVFEIVNDPVIRALVLAQVEADIKEKIINAEVIDYQYATGYATWNVLSMFIGVGEISALVKTGKLSRRTVRLLEKFKKLKPCGCFISGTQVLTKEGYKNIEDIVEGDLVWAYDDKTDDLALKKVLSTFTKEFEQVYKIYFGNEVLEATHEHPFFIGGKWLKVDELKQGDLLTLYDGTKVTIDKIEIVNGDFNVYNFEVEDYHTYYVSKNNVLVHNGNPCNWKSVKTFGHAFTRHGSGKKIKNKLIGRLETGNSKQGQWVDNQKAADFLMNDDNYKNIANLKPGESIDINLPEGMGNVLEKIDGEVITKPATKVTVVRGKDNFIKTAIPKNN